MNLINCFQMKYIKKSQTKIHKKSHHKHFPIASQMKILSQPLPIDPQTKYEKNLITNTSKLFPRRKSHHNHFPIDSQMKYTKFSSQSLPNRFPDKKISLQSLPNSSPD